MWSYMQRRMQAAPCKLPRALAPHGWRARACNPPYLTTTSLTPCSCMALTARSCGPRRGWRMRRTLTCPCALAACTSSGALHSNTLHGVLAAVSQAARGVFGSRRMHMLDAASGMHKLWCAGGTLCHAVAAQRQQVHAIDWRSWMAHCNAAASTGIEGLTPPRCNAPPPQLPEPQPHGCAG